MTFDVCIMPFKMFDKMNTLLFSVVNFSGYRAFWYSVWIREHS